MLHTRWSRSTAAIPEQPSVLIPKSDLVSENDVSVFKSVWFDGPQMVRYQGEMLRADGGESEISAEVKPSFHRLGNR
jgi:hypothetical protein